MEFIVIYIGMVPTGQAAVVPKVSFLCCTLEVTEFDLINKEI